MGDDHFPLAYTPARQVRAVLPRKEILDPWATYFGGGVRGGCQVMGQLNGSKPEIFDGLHDANVLPQLERLRYIAIRVESISCFDIVLELRTSHHHYRDMA